MTTIAILIFTTLLIVALMHIGWAFGMAWPAKQRDELVMTVVGLRKGTPLPSASLTVVVAVAIFGLGAVAIWGAGVFALPLFEGLKGWAVLGVAAIFGLRGGVTYLPFGPFRASVEPFRTLNQRYFSPLCVLLSAGYVAIFLSL